MHGWARNALAVRSYVLMLARSGNFKFDDESDEDSFDEDYETKEDNNYD